MVKLSRSNSKQSYPAFLIFQFLRFNQSFQNVKYLSYGIRTANLL